MHTHHLKNTFFVFVFIALVLSGICGYAAENLKVTAVRPNGMLDGIWQADQITVTFNKPVVPLQKIEKISPEWFVMEPEIDGEFQWLGTQTLAFKPAAQLPYATNFKIMIKPGVTAPDGSTLKSAYKWSFQTPVPYVRYTFPHNREKSVDINVTVNINFNIPVPPNALYNYVEIIESAGTEQEKSIDYEIITEDAQPTNDVQVKPLAPLEKDTEYIVVVNNGVSAAEGSLGSQRSWRSVFRTYSKFELLNINDGNITKINPKSTIALHFSNTVEYSEVMKHTTFKPALEKRDYDYSYQQTTINIYGPFLPDTTYEIHISGELTDVFGNTLGSDVQQKITTGPYDPVFTIPTDESIIEAYGDKNIPIEVVNLSKLEAKIKFVSFDSLDIFGAKFIRMPKYATSGVVGSFFDEKEILQYKIKRNTRHYFPFNLEKYLPDNEHGVLIMQFHGQLKENNYGAYKLMMTQVTSLGVTAKFSPVSNSIYVTTLKNGAPVPEASVQIRDGHGKIYWQGKTDSDGYCKSPGWQRLGMPASKNDEPVQWAIVSLKGDYTYTHSQQGTGVSPWEFQIPYEWYPRDEKLDGAIFTDRGIYRVEDTVQVKVVMREKFGLEWRLTDRDSFKVEITDPTGKKVYENYQLLNEFNAFDFNMPISYDAKRGNYGVRVNIPQKLSWESSLYSTFWIEDYRPAEFEVTVAPQKTEYIFGDTLHATISAAYLFGAPLKNAPMHWTLFKTHHYPQPQGWDGYYFHPDRNFNGQAGGLGNFSNHFVRNEGTLNESGSIKIRHLLQEPDLLTSARYTIEGEVIDQNRRRITGQQDVVVYSGEYLVGVKPHSFFGKKNEYYPIDVMTINHDSKAISTQKVNIKIIQRNWHSVKKAGTGGRYFWRTEIADSTVDEHAIITGEKPVTYNFIPEKSGYYLLRASSTDARGNIIVADCSFYILGNDYVAWSRADDDRIELERNKEYYKPGETAKILIKSPFEAATALITVEREGIIDHFNRQVVGSIPTLEIPIRDIYLPNVYVSVMLIQGRLGDNMYSESGEDIGKPAFKLGYINLPVETGLKKMAVEIKTNKQVYRPGESVTVNLKALNASGKGSQTELIIAVVDKGVLNLTGYRFTNLHDYFYRNRPLSVTTSESRLNIIGQRHYGEKGEDVGGGGASGMSAMARKNFKATTYWNPSLITDRKGEATATFLLPDNLTTFVIMVAGHDNQSNFGNSEHAIKVNQPLVLKPALPRFVRFGDELKAGTVVHNYSDAAADITVTAEVSGITLSDETNQQNLHLGAGESREIRFNFKATRVGDAQFIFHGRMGKESDAVLKTIPIQKPLTDEVVATSKNSTENNIEKIIVPKNCYSEMTMLEVKTAATQLVGISDGVSYLFDYPYGCLEQKISRILPMILFEDVVKAFDFTALKGKDYRKEVQNFFDYLIDFQTPVGGFSYWENGQTENPYVSAWVVFGMIKAKAAGYKINNDVLSKAVAYIQNVLKSQVNKEFYPYTWNYWSVTNCLILYDLSLMGKSDHAYIEKMYQERQRVPLFGKAYLLKAMKLADSQPEMYEDVLFLLLNGLKDSPTTAHFEEPDELGLEWCFHTNVRTTAHILQTLLELKEDFPQAPKVVKWLIMKRNMDGRWQNTQENIFVLHALNSYFKAYEKQEPDFKLMVQLADNKILETNFEGYSFKQEMIQKNLGSHTEESELELSFKKKGEGRYYYETRLTYFPEDPVDAVDRGISVLKKWEVVEGERPGNGEIAAGSVIKVTLTIAVSAERNYVVVDDPLPAGFEVINTRLKTVSERYKQYNPLKLSGGYWGGFNFYELFDDRVLVFADNLSAGVHTFVYLCHALTSGQFVAPATKAEEMYTPEVFGREKESQIIIR